MSTSKRATSLLRLGLSGAAAAALVGLSGVSWSQGFPAIGPLPAKKAPDPRQVEMGRRLFFDPRISGDGAISCASCHDPKQGFTRQVDNKGKPQGRSGAYPRTRHFRHSPTLINTTY